MKKLLIFSDCIFYGGSEVVITNILKSERINSKFDLIFAFRSHKKYCKKDVISKTGFKNLIPIKIFSNDNLKHSLQKFGPIRFVLLALPIFFEKLGLYSLYNSIRFIFLLRQTTPNIIYINNGGYPGAKNCLLFAIIARFFGVESVIMNVNNLAFTRRKFSLPLFDRIVVNSVDKFVTASISAGDRLIEARGVCKNKILNIPNTLFISEDKSSQPVNIKDYFIIGSVGLLTKRKGFNILIKAVEILVLKYNVDNVRVLIYGEGEERDNLLSLIRERNLDNIVLLKGHSSNVMYEMELFDIFVLPSISNEDMPYVLLEAMTLSKPLIGTRIAGIPELIENNYNGYVVNPNDEFSLAESIYKLVSDQKLCKKFGERSQSLFYEKFSYDVIMEKYFCLFQNEK
jgi:glycosyltransferase involved in cell wall biosynthesis